MTVGLTTYRKSAGRGFSLVETMVALAILAVGVVALLGVHARAMRTAVGAKNLMHAARLADTLVREVQFSSSPVLGQQSGRLQDGGGLSWQRWVARLRGGNLYSIQVTVTYPGPAGEKTLTMTSYWEPQDATATDEDTGP